MDDVIEDGFVFRPINGNAKRRKGALVKSGPNYAAAKWTGTMWAYDMPDMTVQLDFEPTHYAVRRP